MHLTTLLDRENLYIGYDAEARWLFVDWRGEYDQQTTWDSCELLLRTLRQYPCARILNDNTNLTRTTVRPAPEFRQWVAELEQAGLRFLAWVYPADFAARRAFENLIQHRLHPIITGFDDLASAYDWLRRQEVAPHRADRVE